MVRLSVFSVFSSTQPGLKRSSAAGSVLGGHEEESIEMVDFELDEQVLCVHSDKQLYTAKIVEVNHKQKRFPYKVHFKGWKKSWDKFVAPQDLYKYSVENLALQAKQKKEAQEKEEMANLALEAKSNKGKKRGRSTGSSAPRSKFKIALDIPKVLRDQLDKDYESVNISYKLVSLPSSPSVNELLDTYLSEKRKPDESTQNVVKGLRTYFNFALGQSLLYNFEKPQFTDLKKEKGKNWFPAESYGAEHLLRLFVRLPELLQSHPWGFNESKNATSKIADVLYWLRKNRDSLFKESEYVETEEEYVKKLKNL